MYTNVEIVVAMLYPPTTNAEKNLVFRGLYTQLSAAMPWNSMQVIWMDICFYVRCVCTNNTHTQIDTLTPFSINYTVIIVFQFDAYVFAPIESHDPI